MKKLSILGILLISVLLFGCYSSDEDNGNAFISLEIQDAFTIENNENYSVGDVIFVELSFSRYLDEEGFDTLLDIYESTDSEAFSYAIRLEKLSTFSNNFEQVRIASDFIFAEKGEVTEFNEIRAVLNRETNMYESRVGITLAEAGDYKFNFDFMFLSSAFKQGKVQIDIQHRFSENNVPVLEFTVTE